MKSRVLVPLIVTISTASILMEQKATTAQELHDANRVNSNWNNSPKIQQIPVLSIDSATEPAEKIQRSSSYLRTVADSIQINHHQGTRKRSISPLEFFKLPSLPSSLKVPIKHF